MSDYGGDMREDELDAAALEVETRAGFADDVDDKVDNTPTPASPTVPVPDSPLFEPMDDDNSAKVDNMDGTSSPPVDEMEDLAVQSEHSSGLSELSASPLDGLKRARAIKAGISTKLRILKPKTPYGRRRYIEDDPENHLIKTLREEESMSWEAIATHLNTARLQRGEPGNLSAAAIYSRFVRNGPRVAAALGQVDFDPKDYMHLRNPASNPKDGRRRTTQLGIGRGRKRVREEGNEEEELAASMRTRRGLVEDEKELKGVEMTEELAKAVARVNANFWTYVSDELQRTTGTEYKVDPRACESRFHAI